MNIAIIGNGPSLLGTGFGKKIDSCDEVLRFNNFQITGHEKDAGSKTTMWAGFQNFFHLAERTDTVHTLFFAWCGYDKLKRGQAWVKSRRMEEKYTVTIVSQEVIKAAYLLLAAKGSTGTYPDTPKPTTGYNVLLHLLAHYFSKQDNIYVCGYDSYTQGNKYFDGEKSRHVQPNTINKHTVGIECKSIEVFHSLGILRYMEEKE